MSKGRPWRISDRADTLEAERRRIQPKRSDEIVASLLARIGQPSARPGLRENVRALAVLLKSRRLVRLDDEALIALARGQQPLLLRKGLSFRSLVVMTAAIREMTFRKLGMRHHKVQVMGGLALLEGRIVEMATGEGKTITTLFAAIIAALAGVPVHVVTVNEYLAERDCETLRPVIEAFGLRVGLIKPDTDYSKRPAIYRNDVVFVTNKDVAFDYLRDRIAASSQSTALGTLAYRTLSSNFRDVPRNLGRGLGFAIVDEVDSILIDEAQTPLIITAERGAGDTGEVMRTFLLLAEKLREGTHFRVSRNKRTLQLTQAGEDVAEALSAPSPELVPLAARRERLIQALSALHLYRRDEHYVLTDEGVAIVDEYTGRVMADRQWQRGLHQMIQIKENVEQSALRETIAQITYQTFFGRYRWFGGMTGTAREVARELMLGHGRTVLRLPTNRPVRRRYWRTRVLGSGERRWQEVVREVQRMTAKGRPVLIGTRSVDASEAAAQWLRSAGFDLTVLNARQNAEEAAVVAAAGKAGQVTVATNMAGRGTDIPVPAEVERRGGLHVILTEFHTSSRIDRQFYGRAGRQGQRGSAIAIVSLEDDLFLHFSPVLVRLIRALSFGWKGRFPAWIGEALRLACQQRAERLGHSRRARTIRSARRLERSLGFRPDNI